MSSPFAGRNIGKYKIGKQVGHGMSMVFKAFDPESKKDVALKLVHLGSSGGREIAEFERRGAILQGRLRERDAPVPSVYELGEADDYFYVAMEYVEGEDLIADIGRGALDNYRAAGIAIDICEFLEKAHSFDESIDGKPA